MAQASSTLIVVDSAPYGSFRCREALDMALALAAFDQPVTLLLRAAAVNWLRPDQEPAGIEQKSLARNLGAAPIYGVDRIVAEKASLAAYAMTENSLPDFVTVAGEKDLVDLFAHADRVFNF